MCSPLLFTRSMFVSGTNALRGTLIKPVSLGDCHLNHKSTHTMMFEKREILLWFSNMGRVIIQKWVGTYFLKLSGKSAQRQGWYLLGCRSGSEKSGTGGDSQLRDPHTHTEGRYAEQVPHPLGGLHVGSRWHFVRGELGRSWLWVGAEDDRLRRTSKSEHSWVHYRLHGHCLVYDEKNNFKVTPDFSDPLFFVKPHI